MKPNLSIILPTYNERGNIVELISAIHQQFAPESWTYEVVVVDDNSPDGTAAAVEEAFHSDSRVKVLLRTTDRGLAKAIRHGITHSDSDVVAVMDTDFNHDPRMLPQMVKFLEYYDLIIGSRFCHGGGMEDRLRYYSSFVYNLFARIVLGTYITDNLSGFFTVRRDKLEKLQLERICFGYGEYYIRLLYLAAKSNFSILEVPVFYQLRPAGQSKSRFLRMFWDYTLTVFKLPLKRL